jgi:hypothetical protein
MLINISEDSLNRGLLAIVEAIGSLPKGQLVRDLSRFYNELNDEKLKTIEIELQAYDDSNLLLDTLLSDNPEEVLQVDF